MTDPDRRSALASFAGAALVGSAVALTGCSKDQEGESESSANEDLVREHGVLRRILIIYRETSTRLTANAAVIDAAALAGAARLFQAFGERYHEQLLEEQHIFPIVQKVGGDAARLVDTLLRQHARGREITAYVLDRTRTGSVGTGDAEPLAKALAAFSRMYEPHTAREDTIIFPAFKKAVGPKGYDALGDIFEDIKRKEFGGDGFEMAIEKVADLERRIGIADLAAFTAPVTRTRL